MRRSLLRSLTAAMVLSLGACATVAVAPPQSLLDARVALAVAKQADAETLARDEYLHAQRLLAQAEAAFGAEHPMTRVDDLAFEARAEAQVAEALARARSAVAEHLRIQQEILVRQDLLLALQEKDRRLQEAVVAGRAQEAGRLEAEARAAQEQAARIAAEKEAEMLRRARQIKEAEVKLESRGLVIALSGRILFDSGSSKLQPGVAATLDQVAALLRDYPDRPVRIEGHTDSTGDLLFNNTLSAARAESVLTYLNQRGTPLDSLSAVGLGPTRPVANNATVSGRQLNRRVEIVIERPTALEARP